MPGTDYIVELEPGVWIAPIVGDPGRTLDRASATRFHSELWAKAALRKAREYRPFLSAQIVPEYFGLSEW